MPNKNQVPSPVNKIHHIGIAVTQLESASAVYGELFGLRAGPIIELENLGIRGCFIPIGETNLELLESTHQFSEISKFINSHGEGLHHICFEVSNVGECLTNLEMKGIALKDKEPRPGLAGGLIGFLESSVSNEVLIEISQHQTAGE